MSKSDNMAVRNGRMYREDDSIYNEAERITTKTATIANGTNISGEIDLADYQFAAIQMPAAWTAANLAFQAATASGGTPQDVYDDAGVRVTVTAAASHCIAIDLAALKLAALRFIKIASVSATDGSAVNQAADRTLTLILKR